MNAEATPFHAPLHDAEFLQFRTLIHRVAGISMSSAKKALVAGRLAKRLKHYGLSSYGEYYRLLTARQDEMQMVVDLLTTNETYFFREEKHFDRLRQQILPQHPVGRPLRVWSAASSTGEEAYSIAMLLADALGNAPWEIFGSDISTRVLERARAGVYDLDRAKGIPQAYLRAYCLKGVGSQAGRLQIDPVLRRRVSFAQVNLNEPLPDVGQFDVIFLRNVMIYFEAETKQRVIARLIERLRPGGWFFIGHSESLNGLSHGLVAKAPSVYRKE
ncbi:MAG: protein-glutamate O-methyltransferase CheR [Chromatiales bacterium]|nr:protein-glutamate O-methyltransferase CheR [Chromatiales bacterium]MDX9767056.1 protein-glutamate O-methyltransferase CheR [Ectothiorhodospiraceae bacterium]